MSVRPAADRISHAHRRGTVDDAAAARRVEPPPRRRQRRAPKRRGQGARPELALGRAVATLGEVDSVLSEMGRKKASDKRRRSLTSSLSLTTIEAVPEPPAPSMSSV